MSAAVVAGFMLLALFGLPIAFAMGAASLAALGVSGVGLSMVPQRMMHAVNSFPLMSIPFFMLAGEIMSAGGLSQRLIRVADVLVRHLPGGMGHVTVVSACIFAAISGSAPATTAAIGAILIPAMVARGYDKAFATALTASAMANALS